jgi:pimeloyl-ACP methyl ester carboxylesterase
MTIVIPLAFAVGACSSPVTATPTPSLASEPSVVASPTPTQDVLAQPSIGGSFVVTADGRKLALACWGQGEPTVILEGGDASGLDQWTGSALVRLIAPQTRVCAYDRAGGSESDPAPNVPRDADDLVEELHALLTEADVPTPHVMVGNSFGGVISAYYAARFPEDVVGVVLLDTAAPEAEMTVEDFPEGAWDHPGNVEHLDNLKDIQRFARDPLPMDAPLIVITATDGDSSVEDQGDYWLPLSPDARQVELSGGHDIYEDQPRSVADEVLKLVEAGA